MQEKEKSTSNKMMMFKTILKMKEKTATKKDSRDIVARSDKKLDKEK